jgi:prepilin-type N-terminal cleavage/methylation domain-containing protein
MKNNKQGFTLLEVLLVVAIIAILAGIVILAINPNKQLADSRNAQRKADVNTILNAVYQYSIDNNGNLPPTITGSATEICLADTASSTCTSGSLINLNHLVWSEKYLTSLPIDPSEGCATNGICYQISTSTNGRVTVTAPGAEQGQTISVTR